jgi:hypothetical protein
MVSSSAVIQRRNPEGLLRQAHVDNQRQIIDD